ncbi:hypothetical protein Pmar_PMAR003585 [Perkinsus marinus ATCC 50983]|uniref:Uncharacterized protein n=1 Tax=Perkinsus marinus (strain ATCC 50983 / TXsc) TaxID=423536 RepID=C5KHR0_PERM5|nr:hypothetical protein Pmar_PMAR003585 [Perkinsus marinus ATCC 50983]EER16122.1 hypothetical protein Pmar_PMAR003585 [Perkinsus marinus ATCC 50983]|eukprot:XP_002784326.1 hypothetical protein Pmar_PMAR003585 [Perkinsus marinus ATCC 50983]
MSPEEPQRSPHRHHTAARRRRFTEPTAHASTHQGRPGNIDLTISLLTRLVQGHDPDRILTEVLAYQGDMLPWGARAM